MKRCELCKSMARTFCESDQASLCWSCDAKVHGANFLVARHSRTLLCHLCQSPTPWQAAGAKLGHTVSFCLRCVVPWASSDSTPPPPAESSSSSSYSSDSDGGESIQSAVSTKRTREGCVDLCSLLQVCLANQYSKFHFISPSKF
ncbi:B-box domain protein 31 [Linum perenne]